MTTEAVGLIAELYDLGLPSQPQVLNDAPHGHERLAVLDSHIIITFSQ